mmetsp:Transcript_960/g.3149  ORF Transcript_960/g.3149 Transcript_960/m.3149 type:complete len:256 (-) Transcript_960:1316-2083(-)
MESQLLPSGAVAACAEGTGCLRTAAARSLETRTLRAWSCSAAWRGPGAGVAAAAWPGRGLRRAGDRGQSPHLGRRCPGPQSLEGHGAPLRRPPLPRRRADPPGVHPRTRRRPRPRRTARCLDWARMTVTPCLTTPPGDARGELEGTRLPVGQRGLASTRRARDRGGAGGAGAGDACCPRSGAGARSERWAVLRRQHRARATRSCCHAGGSVGCPRSAPATLVVARRGRGTSAHRSSADPALERPRLACAGSWCWP